MRQALDQAHIVRARTSGDAAGLFAPLGVKAWRGASGRSFTHIVYSLIGCPAIPSGNFVLVQHGADGQRNVLGIGRTEASTASLNLARIRREGAGLGANEVHVYAAATTDQARAAIAFDIAAANEVAGSSDIAHH